MERFCGRVMSMGNHDSEEYEFAHAALREYCSDQTYPRDNWEYNREGSKKAKKCDINPEGKC
jgi:hypothetical protein